MKLKQNAKAPLSTWYHPEPDVSNELDEEGTSYYQSLIGILRWAMELGRINICAEVLMVASSLAIPREGHLLQVLRIFSYLKNMRNI